MGFQANSSSRRTAMLSNSRMYRVVRGPLAVRSADEQSAGRDRARRFLVLSLGVWPVRAESIQPHQPRRPQKRSKCTATTDRRRGDWRPLGCDADAGDDVPRVALAFGLAPSPHAPIATAGTPGRATCPRDLGTSVSARSAHGCFPLGHRRFRGPDAGVLLFAPSTNGFSRLVA